MRNDKDNLIVRLTFDFALRIIAFSEEIRQMNRFEMLHKFLEVEHQLEPISEKPKMQKVEQILFINLKFLKKKPMN